MLDIYVEPVDQLIEGIKDILDDKQPEKGTIEATT